MNRHTKKSTLPREFNGSNPEEIIRNPSIIANKFNEYFINVGPAIAKKFQIVIEPFVNFYQENTETVFFLTLSQNMN